MSRPLRLLVGVATVAPFFSAIALNVAVRDGEASGAFIVGMIATLAGVVFVTFAYLLHVVRNDEIRGPHKVAWAAALVVLTIGAAIVYWYRHIWRAY